MVEAKVKNEAIGGITWKKNSLLFTLLSIKRIEDYISLEKSGIENQGLILIPAPRRIRSRLYAGKLFTRKIKRQFFARLPGYFFSYTPRDFAWIMPFLESL